MKVCISSPYSLAEPKGNSVTAQRIARLLRSRGIDARASHGFDGGSADNNYGQYPADGYTRDANEQTWLLAQVESPRAVENADAIAAVDGIDGVFFGPGDYSALTGTPGQIKSDSTIEAARKTADATIAAGKLFGTLVFDHEHAEIMRDAGAKLLVYGADILYYRGAFEKALSEMADLKG